MRATTLITLANIIETSAKDYAVISIVDNTVFGGIEITLERFDSGHVLKVSGDTPSSLEKAIINGVQPF